MKTLDECVDVILNTSMANIANTSKHGASARANAKKRGVQRSFTREIEAYESDHGPLDGYMSDDEQMKLADNICGTIVLPFILSFLMNKDVLYLVVRILLQAYLLLRRS